MLLGKGRRYAPGETGLGMMQSFGRYYDCLECQGHFLLWPIVPLA